MLGRLVGCGVFGLVGGVFSVYCILLIMNVLLCRLKLVLCVFSIWVLLLLWLVGLLLNMLIIVVYVLVGFMCSCMLSDDSGYVGLLDGRLVDGSMG